MSYDFTGASTDRAVGSLSSGIDISSTGLTIAAYAKISNHPAALQ